MFLINEGKVTVFDSRTTWKILSYIIGSYFGDIQILNNIKSNFNY